MQTEKKNYQHCFQYRTPEFQTLMSMANYHSMFFRNLFVDAVVLSGTAPGISYIKALIEKEELQDTQCLLALMTLPMSVKNPTPNILKEIMVNTNNAYSNHEFQLLCFGQFQFSNVISKEKQSQYYKTFETKIQ